MLATLYPTELVQPSAQPQDMSRVFIALGPWKSILMGRIFEGEEFYMVDSQVSLSTMQFYFIKYLITYLNLSLLNNGCLNSSDLYLFKTESDIPASG